MCRRQSLTALNPWGSSEISPFLSALPFNQNHWPRLCPLQGE
jgi:hypothetical protein